MVGFIELFSEIFRMLTLTLRLWGNVFGGEIMLVVMSGLLFLPGLALPFVGLEVFIGLVQGLVFALLVLMYFILAIESHDEEHEEGSHTDTDRVPSPEIHPETVAAH
jgi:F-type H+-transporting ATPase subunit a